MSVVANVGFRKRLWRLARKPEGIIESTRWLFALMALVALLLTLPAVLPSVSGGRLAVALAAAAALAVSCGYVYLSRRIPIGLDVLDAVVIFAFALVAPTPSALAAYVFEAVWFRAFYGSTRRSLIRCVLSIAAVAATIPLWPQFHGGGTPNTEALFESFPLLFLVILIARQLLNGLFAREQGMLRDNALAATGTLLLGVTDPVAIRGLAWTATTEICAATPGLRVLKAVRDGSALRVEGATGGFQTVPVALPGEVIADSANATILDPTPLNGAVGAELVWDCIRLTEQQEFAWLLIGAPKKLPPVVLLTMRSLVNQVSLALRNSDVHQQLTVQARFDSLTGLENRASFTAKLSNSLAHSDRAGGLNVLFLDLDDFKNVNDVLGHRAGDMVLIEVATRLRQCTRPEDVCARLGGDEFAVLVRGTTEADVTEIAGRIVESLAAPISLGDRTVLVGASVGIASASPAIDIDELVHRADVAMYAAKANGKGRAQVFDPGLLQSDPPHIAFERKLAAAADAGELVVYYQPIVSLPGLRCTAVEALVRWQHPERGLILPDDFIETAERTGAIVGIGAFVLRRACAEAATWSGRFPGRPLAVHVNISARELDTELFIDNVLECLADTGLPADRLVLELTETIMLDSPDAIRRLRTIAAHGVQIAVDDFGTGYSSLTTLRALPVAVIKLDTSFVTGAVENPVDRSVIEAIVQMSTKLGIHTIAEGVERLEQQRLLERIGTDAVQGHLYARALPAVQLGAWLRGNLAAAEAEHDAEYDAECDGREVVTLLPRSTA